VQLDKLFHRESLDSSITKRTVAGKHDETFVGSFGAGSFPATVYRGPEEMRTRVGACRVDIIVLCEVAHDDCCAKLK